MARWLPEGTTVLPSSDEMRTLAVWLQTLINGRGDPGHPFYPEGSKPFPSDDEQKLYHKINYVLESTASPVFGPNQLADQSGNVITDEFGNPIGAPF